MCADKKWAPDDDRGGPPQAGLFRPKLHKRGHPVAAAIEQLADGTWRAVVNDTAHAPVVDAERCPYIMKLWHYAQRATPEQHQHLVATKSWALRNSPLHPILHPTQPIRTDRLPPHVPARKVVPA